MSTTVFVTENDDPFEGIKVPLVFAEMPQPTEDIYVVSQEEFDRRNFKKCEKWAVELGNRAYPLNLYASDVGYALIDLSQKVPYTCSH